MPGHKLSELVKQGLPLDKKVKIIEAHIKPTIIITDKEDNKAIIKKVAPKVRRSKSMAVVKIKASDKPQKDTKITNGLIAADEGKNTTLNGKLVMLNNKPVPVSDYAGIGTTKIKLKRGQKGAARANGEINNTSAEPISNNIESVNNEHMREDEQHLRNELSNIINSVGNDSVGHELNRVFNIKVRKETIAKINEMKHNNTDMRELLKLANVTRLNIFLCEPISINSTVAMTYNNFHNKNLREVTIQQPIPQVADFLNQSGFNNPINKTRVIERVAANTSYPAYDLFYYDMSFMINDTFELLNKRFANLTNATKKRGFAAYVLVTSPVNLGANVKEYYKSMGYKNFVNLAVVMPYSDEKKQNIYQAFLNDGVENYNLLSEYGYQSIGMEPTNEQINEKPGENTENTENVPLSHAEPVNMNIWQDIQDKLDNAYQDSLKRSNYARAKMCKIFAAFYTDIYRNIHITGEPELVASSLDAIFASGGQWNSRFVAVNGIINELIQSLEVDNQTYEVESCNVFLDMFRDFVNVIHDQGQRAYVVNVDYFTSKHKIPFKGSGFVGGSLSVPDSVKFNDYLNIVELTRINQNLFLFRV